MLSGVGAFFGKLFGTDKALESVVNGVSSSLDKLVYTDEEKAEDHAKSVTEARRMVVDWMAATSGQNLARRLIALAITGVWLGMYLLSVFANMVAVFIETDDKLVELSIIAHNSANDMGGAVMLILAFYFAAPHMGDIASAALGKMKADRGG